MLILSVDTSGKSGGLTLAKGDSQSFQLLDSTTIPGGMFSAQLIPELASLLQKHNFQVKELDGFCVVSGPGSFTGLRVGLSAVKGLAEVLKKPVVPVSLLEALALVAKREGRIAAVLDAGRAELFWGLYEVSHGRAFALREVLFPGTTLSNEIAAASPGCLVTCDSSVVSLKAAFAGIVCEIPRPGSACIAQIGLGKLLSGETVSVEKLDANYIRRSDAEILAKTL